MKRLGILTVLIATIFSASLAYSAESTIKQYPYLYKSPRAMGMGGAYVAIGGKTDALFYNPAGLSMMPEKNFEVNIIGLSVEAGKKVYDFANDLKDAFDVGDKDGDGDKDDDRLKAVNDALRKYRGENFHLGLANWTSLGRNQGDWAFAVGGVGSARADIMAHQGLGSEGILEVSADAVFGGIGGLSLSLGKGFYGGVGIKGLHRESLVHKFSAQKLIEEKDRLGDYITKDLRKRGNAVGFDAGLIYKFAQNYWLKPKIGLSVMNIGDLRFGDAGKIPMTVNVGVAVKPEIPVFSSLEVGLDYVDLFKNYKEDKDIGKRVRFGGELNLIDKKLLTVGLRAGLYQGYPTFGADLRFLIFNVSYVTYAEEIGAYAGQDRDRRHMVMLNIGW